MQNSTSLSGLLAPEQAREGEGLGCVDFDTAFFRTLVASPGDIDELGHVNNVVYLRWVQAMAVTHWRQIAPADMVDNDIWVALKHTIEYRDPILPGEKAELRTWLGEVRGPRFDRHVDIRKPGSRRFSARSVTEWCRLDMKSRRPKRIGPEVMRAFGLPL
ncbi:acyl-CoA thioesterase [Maricaulis sp. CAU 1757]